MKALIRKLIDLSLIKILRYVNSQLKSDSLAYKHNLHAILWERAIIDSADYVQPYLSEVLVFKDTQAIWDYSIQQLLGNDDGVCLEFGVYQGRSINYFSRKLSHLQFYGFDSFEGLAEDWKGHDAKKGSFNLEGVLPKTNSNVELTKGWFNETLPPFCKADLNSASLVFVHIDGDTYEAASIVLGELRDFIKPGLLILFDEYIGYPNWRNGEFLAWKKFVERNNIKYRYRAFCTEQSLIEVIG